MKNDRNTKKCPFLVENHWVAHPLQTIENLSGIPGNSLKTSNSSPSCELNPSSSFQNENREKIYENVEKMKNSVNFNTVPKR